jgi:hypothetical protein
VALDPDEQVQAVVRLVFRLFDELGTVHAVLRFLVEYQVQIGMRERSGPGKGEVAWRAPAGTCSTWTPERSRSRSRASWWTAG